VVEKIFYSNACLVKNSSIDFFYRSRGEKIYNHFLIPALPGEKGGVYYGQEEESKEES